MSTACTQYWRSVTAKCGHLRKIHELFLRVGKRKAKSQRQKAKSEKRKVKGRKRKVKSGKRKAESEKQEKK